MHTQEDLRETIESGRDELVETLARNNLLPAVVEGSGGSDLPGMSAPPTFRLDTESGDSNVSDRQTTTKVVETLGLESEDDCEEVREEIQEHPAWSED